MCQEDKWRIEMIKELTDIKFGQLELDGFSNEECEEILNFACVSQWMDDRIWMVPVLSPLPPFRGFLELSFPQKIYGALHTLYINLYYVCNMVFE